MLSRDIRSLHKRLGTAQQEGLYHVLLEGVDVSYEVVEGVVEVRHAELGGTGGRLGRAPMAVTEDEETDTGETISNGQH